MNVFTTKFNKCKQDNYTVTQERVFLEIMTDDTNDKLSKKILKMLETLGIEEYYYTHGTNYIRAFTKGNESEISEKVSELKKNPHVKKISKEILVRL